MTIVRIICLVVLSINLCLAQITTVVIPHFATSGNDVPIQNFPDLPMWNAAGGKYIFARSYIPSPGRVIVFERDDQEKYSTAYQMPWARTPDIMSTNGNWFGTLGQGYVDTFQLTANGTFVNITSFATTASVLQFLSDDTLILISDKSILTYEFLNGNWSQTRVDTLRFPISARPYFIMWNGGSDTDSTPHITDTTMALFNADDYSIELFIRHTDKSWEPFEHFPLDRSARANRILWNGDDTVVIAHTTFYQNSSYGRVLIYTKNSRRIWNLAKVVVSRDLSDIAPAYFGYSLLLYNQNTILVSAPNENDGEVYYLRRINGEWQFTTRFRGINLRFCGRVLMKNDYDIVIQTALWNFNRVTYQMVIPPCYMPIRYKCQDVTLDTCQTSLPYDQLYTVGDNCTNVNVTNTYSNGDATTFTFEFARDYSDTFYCNATVTCTSPPTVPPSDPPISEPIVPPLDAPMGAPVVPPVNDEPISTPTNISPISSPSQSPLSTPATIPSEAPTSATTPSGQPIALPTSPIISPASQPLNAPVGVSPTSIPTDEGKVTSNGYRLLLSTGTVISVVMFVYMETIF